VTLGGNGTHKTANLLAQEGLHVIGLPKTIDNDLFGTDVTFGFDTAVGIVTEVLDRLHTTAASHSRIMVVEVMGNKVGWLTLYSGIAGGADVILLPEIPYDLQSVVKAIERRAKMGKQFSIIAVAEGALDIQEASLKKRDLAAKREQEGFLSIAHRIAKELGKITAMEVRAVVPGHIQRGGSPSAQDRVLSTQFGVHASQLIRQELYGTTVAMLGATVGHNMLSDVAGKTKSVPPDHQLVTVARSMGICLGD
jgi:6-phosphofructokinase 1